MGRTGFLLTISILLLGIRLHGTEFKELELPSPSTTMAISEDGRLLFIGHEEQNTISVVETVSKKSVKSIKCKAPRHILCRGKKLYVANFGHGTVSVISLDAMKLSDELSVPNKDVYYLSAAHGKHFNGRIIVSCGRYGKHEYHEVDTAKDTCRLLRKETYASVATVDYQGTHVVLQGELANTPSGKVRAFTYGDFGRGRRAKTLSGAHESLPIINQYQRGSFWIGGNVVCYGMAPRRVMGQDASVLFKVPDVLSKTYYSVTPKKITLQQLNIRFAKVLEWDVTLPASLNPKRRSRRSGSKREYHCFGNLAARFGEHSYVFVYSRPEKKIYHCHLVAGQGKKAAPTAFALTAKKFTPIPLNEPGTTMCMTEDGKFLIVGHRSSDLITVWDIVNEKVAKSIKCSKPISIISRGEKVYAANAGKGTITVISTTTWKPTDQVLVGAKDIVFLSAPRGRHFQSKLLATCIVENSHGRSYEVDVAKDESRQVHQSHSKDVAVVSYNGGHVVLHRGQLQDSPEVYAYGDFVKGRGARAVHGESVQFPAQFREGSFWFSANQLHAQMPPGQRKRADKEKHYIPDITRNVYYELSGVSLTAVSLNIARTPLKSYRVTPPPPLSIAHHRVPRDFLERRNHFNLAATHGKHTYAFVLDCDMKVYGVKLPVVERRESAVKYEDLKFQVLGLESAATSMSMMESGKYLIVCHGTADLLSVWDVEKRILVKTVRCRSPKFALCRGNTVYVANYGHGTITVIPAKTWKPRDEVRVGDPKVHYLSAPGGDHFKGKIIATGGEFKTAKSYLVDIKSDRSTPLQTDTYTSVTTVGYDGKNVIQQGTFGHSPSATVTAYNYQSYIAAGARSRSMRGAHADTPLLAQFRKGNYWLGANFIYAGMPPRKVGEAMGKHVVPDLAQDAFFVMDDAKITAYSLNARRARIHEWPVTLPKGLGKRPSRYQGKYYHNVGVTLGDHAYLFLLDGTTGAVVACRLPASGKALIANAAKGLKPGEMPKAIPEGKLFRFQVSGKKNVGTYDVIRGPKGIQISKDGEMTWTPTKDDVGKVNLKIRSDINDEVTFYRYSLEVVPAKLAAQAGDRALSSLGRFTVFNQQYSIAPSCSFRNVIFNADNKLRVLDVQFLILLGFGSCFVVG